MSLLDAQKPLSEGLASTPPSTCHLARASPRSEWLIDGPGIFRLDRARNCTWLSRERCRSRGGDGGPGPQEKQGPIGDADQVIAQGFDGMGFGGGEVAELLGQINRRIEPVDGVVSSLLKLSGELLVFFFTINFLQLIYERTGETMCLVELI